MNDRIRPPFGDHSEQAVIVLGDIEALTSLEAGGRRLEGVIVGKALYEGQFTVEEAMAACAACA